MVYDEGDDFRAVLDVTASAAFTIVPSDEVYSTTILLPGVDLPVPAFPGIIMSVNPVVVPAVKFEGGVSAKVKGTATLLVGGRLDRSTNRIWPVFDPGVTVEKPTITEAAGRAKPKLDLKLGLSLTGTVSVFKVAGVRMGVTPYYRVEIEPGDCGLEIDPSWGVDASVTAFLKRPLPWSDLEWILYHDLYGPIDLSSFPPALACVDTVKPTRPGGLTATRAGRDVELRWSASSDNSGVVTAYRVYRGSGRIGTTGGTSYVDRNPGTGRHCYRVKAVAGNLSSYSSSKCATVPRAVPPPRPPAKPAIEIVDQTSRSARVRWAEDANVRYSVLIRLDGLWEELVRSASSPELVVPRGAGLRSCYRVRATNAAGSTDSDSRCFTPQGNTPPTAYAGDDFTVVARELGTLRGRGTDADGHVTGYAWTQTPRPTVTLSGASTAVATFTAPETDVETTLTFQLTVTDNGGATHTNDVRATVLPAATPANGPPTADAGDRQNVTAGERVTLSGSGSSDDRGIVSWRWEQYRGSPIVSLFGASLQDATFVAPSVTEVTDLRFRLTVTDGAGATDRDTVRVTVSPPATNRPPTANAGRDQSVASGAAVTLSGSGSDPDGDALSYAWRQTDDGPTVTLSGASLATATFTAPTVSAPTTLEFQLTVTDNAGATASDTVDVTVSPAAANRPPAANAGRDQSVASGAAVTLNGSGSDPDGDALSYAWRQTDGPTVTLSGASSATATFKAPAVTTRTTLTFRLTVTDDDSATGADYATVTVVPADGDAPVNIPDAALRAELLAALDKLAGDTITRADMAGLDSHLGIGERGVADLTGLEYATSLTSLTILDNSISDISALSALTSLTRLELYDNPLSDISALSALTSLTSLSLYGNPVSDISALSGLTSLTSLILSGFPIADISALSRLTSLTRLTLRRNEISNISALSALTSLTDLALDDNSISDISALSGLTSLTGLRLGTNWISDISALSGLTSLSGLYLDDNSISDISALSGLTSLSGLYLNDNSISDISGLSGLTSLRSLSLGGNSISDISTLSSTLSRLTSLRHLYLRSNSISDISGLSGLTSLTSLDLYNNPISDISGLSGLTSLTWLSLDDNSISDISALSGLTSLKHLDLDDNSISDAGPLVDNTGLGRGDRIYLRCNPLSAQSVNTHIPTLRARGANVLWTACSNRPPVADAGLDQSVAAGAAVTLNGGGSDPDGSVAGYAWTQTGGPTVSLSGASSATATFTAPAATTLTTLTFQLTVTDDDGATDSDTTRVAVSPANLSPVANAGPDQSVAAGAAVTLNGSGSDPDGSVAGYAWTQTSGLPTVSLSGASSATATFTAPAATTGTTLTFQLTVTDDDGATGSDTVRVTVSPANRPPVANAGPDQSVAAGAAVTLNGSGSDPDGRVAGYAWTQTVGTTVSLSGASTAPAVTTRTTLTFQLTVTDDDGATGTDEATVTVSPLATNLPPVANAGLDQSVAAGAAVTLNGSGSDPDGSVAGYAWTQTEGTTVTLSGASTATATFTAPAVTTRTTLTFQLTVTDDDGATGTDEATVTVSPLVTNRPPVANAGLDQSVAAGAAVTLSGSGSDPDGSVAGYAWTQTEGTTVTLSGASSATATFTAPAVTTSTMLTFRLTVTDDDGATGTDEATVTVAPASGNTPVNVPDTALRTRLLAALGKSAGDAITRSDMAGLTALIANRSGIADLTGLEFATSLEELFLQYNSISDISNLSGLTSLDKLWLTNNSTISDISALSGLTSLTRLGLGSSSISDISALSRLTSLTVLDLDGNSISNISALSGLTSLTDLRLGGNSISDFSMLSRLTSLTTLYLHGTSMSDISALSGLTSLNVLRLDENSISDISALSRLTSLTWLELHQNNSISDISALSGLTSLGVLRLDENSISDISALSRLTSLTWLELDQNLIADISALSGLTSLNRLRLNDNSISDISALSGLTSLTDLSLGRNLIADAKPLVDNTGLGSGDRIALNQNPLSTQSVNTHIPALRARGATVICSLVDGTAC